MVPRHRSATPPDRLRPVGAVFLFVAAIILVRLFVLQVLQHEVYAALAEGQRSVFAKLFPRRGEIFLQDRSTPGALSPLAVNRPADLLYAVPAKIEQPLLLARLLAPVLNLEETNLLAKLSKPGDQYEPLLHRAPPALKAAIEQLNLSGLAFQQETVRYYPEGRNGSHLAGFLGYSGDQRQGQYGLEGYYDDALAGSPGEVSAGSGGFIDFASAGFLEAEDGSDLILSIDRTIEFTACEALRSAVERHGAVRGTVIIVDPKTGKLLAVCGVPDFDPNAYNEVEEPGVFTNPAVAGAYEPGSAFKGITMAAALAEQQITPTTTYVDEGSVKIGKYTIKNADGKTYGQRTMTQVLEESINTGAIFAARRVGTEAFRRYVEAFGFGSASGIDLQGEAKGDIANLKKSGDIYLATASFGQGLTVTPLQLLMAYAGIANDGVLMKPSAVEAIVKPDGTRQDLSPEAVRTVVPQPVARTLSAMLTSVVERGHGKRAGVPGYFVAGKTGTAQMHSADGVGYDENRTIGTFVGFAPVDEPRFAMLVRLDEPKDVQFAESTAAPLFGELAKFLLDYLQVPPDREVTTDN